MEDKLQPGVRFYVAPNNNQVGPLTEEVIREKVQAGEYTGELLAWKEGDTAWSSLGHYFPHLFLGTVPEISVTKPAKISDRVVALLIDFVILTIVLMILVAVFTASIGGAVLDPFIPLLIPIYATVMLSSSKKATLGMMMLNLKIVTMKGGVVDLKRALLRSVLAPVISAFFLITYFWAFWDDKNQTLHDKFAGTLVVKA